MNRRDYITFDPAVCDGRACIKGTRVLVATVLDGLAAGLDAGDITRSYPSVTRDSVRAVVSYAAELAKERDARQSRAVDSLEQLRRQAAARGVDQLSMDEIDAEVRASRERERRDSKGHLGRVE